MLVKYTSLRVHKGPEQGNDTGGLLKVANDVEQVLFAINKDFGWVEPCLWPHAGVGLLMARQAPEMGMLGEYTLNVLRIG